MNRWGDRSANDAALDRIIANWHANRAYAEARRQARLGNFASAVEVLRGTARQIRASFKGNTELRRLARGLELNSRIYSPGRPAHELEKLGPFPPA